METFKMILRIVFATGAVIGGLTALVGFTGGPAQAIGICMFWFGFIEEPAIFAFIFVLLYQLLFKRKRVSFFKTELLYLLVQICAWILVSFALDKG